MTLCNPVTYDYPQQFHWASSRGGLPSDYLSPLTQYHKFLARIANWMTIKQLRDDLPAEHVIRDASVQFPGLGAYMVPEAKHRAGGPVLPSATITSEDRHRTPGGFVSSRTVPVPLLRGETVRGNLAVLF